MNFQKSSKSGFTIIEVLVAVALMSIMGLAFMTMMSHMNKEIRTANRKADALELRMLVTRSLSDLSLCSCQLNLHGAAFDSLNPGAELNVAKFQGSCLPSASDLFVSNDLVPGSSTQLKIDQIKVANIESLGVPNRFRGKFKVDYQTDALTFPLRGFEIDFNFRTDPATPVSAKKIQQCDFSTAASVAGITGYCPKGQFAIGVNNGVIQCSAVAVSGAVSNSSSEYSPTNPGPGCTGTMCVTADFGPCDGPKCVTNGKFCNGDVCSACGSGSTCNGTSCNTLNSIYCPIYGF